MALTGKTIGQLDHLTSSLTGDEAFPIQYNGATYHISQSQIVSGLATTGSNQFNGNQTITGSLIQGLEGNIATGEYSHAEGSITKATGDYSHAEGDFTQAKGNYSHAEGQETIASGSYSHAEGLQTIALANHQHVQGQYNSVSSVPAAFIVGNGTDDSNRSNLIYAAENEVQISGSLKVTTGITGSLFGTSSWANNAITASSADNFTVRGTLTATTIVAQTITSSTDFVTGSTRFGSLSSNTHQFTGSVSITGSLAVNSSNVILSNQTGSMSVATASFATSSLSASYALSSSYSLFANSGEGNFSGSFQGDISSNSTLAGNPLIDAYTAIAYSIAL